MLTLILCLCIIVVAEGSLPRRLIDGGRVVNQAALEKDYPWFVLFVMGDDCQAFCGGALVGPSTVLTAAHCFFDAPDAGVNNPGVKAVIGYAGPGPVNAPEDWDNSTGNLTDESVTEDCWLPNMYAIKSVRKPVYYPYVSGYDIALVSLDVSGGCPDVALVKIAGLGYDLQAWVVGQKPWTLLGFGATDGEDEDPSKVLKMLQLPVASVGTSDEFCNMNTTERKRIPSLICSREVWDEKQSGCGDSGGPWTLFDSTINATVYAGVESAGQVNDQLDTFTAMVNPAWFQDWIAHGILSMDSCLADPVPAKDSFFYGFAEDATAQFCTFSNCAACSDQEVLARGQVRGSIRSDVEGCLNLASGAMQPLPSKRTSLRR